jgi:hypothetical protein
MDPRAGGLTHARLRTGEGLSALAHGLGDARAREKLSARRSRYVRESQIPHYLTIHAGVHARSPASASANARESERTMAGLDTSSLTLERGLPYERPTSGRLAGCTLGSVPGPAAPWRFRRGVTVR